jgi:hypothetical protein
LACSSSSPQNKRVVLISHSQETLITAVVLRLIGGVYRHTMAGRRRDLSNSDREAIRQQAAAEGLQPRLHQAYSATSAAPGQLTELRHGSPALRIVLIVHPGGLDEHLLAGEGVG